MLAALAVALFVAFGPANADGHTVSVTFDDSDAVVDDGADLGVIVKAHITTAADVAACPSGTATLNWIRIPGDLSGLEDFTENNTASFVANPGEDTDAGPTACTASFDADSGAEGTQGFEIINPKGAAEGVYVVSAQVSFSTADDTVVGSAELRIGDAGTALASAEIAFGKYTAPTDGEDEIPNNADDVIEGCAKPGATESADDAMATHNGKICLFVSASNSLGNAANPGDVDEIIISGPTGSIQGYTDGVADETDPVGPSENSLSIDAAVNTKYFTVQRTGAGTVTVSAIVIGSGSAGFASATPVELAFAGPAETFEVDDATQTLHFSTIADAVADDDGDGVDTNADPVQTAADDDGDADDETDPPTVKLSFTAFDKAGTPTAPAAGPYTITIKDADGKAVASDKISAGQPATDAKNVTTITVTGHGTETAKLDPGEYTIEVKRGTKSDDAVFSVSAGPGAISLDLGSETVAIGDVVTVTATVTDESGNAVIDGTEVTFEVAGALKLRILGGGADNMVTGETEAGTTSARALVSSGTGSAAFVVSAGTVYETMSVSTEAEAMADEEASVGCLSNLAGFATWACGVESSASEIFGLVSGRGATALHLWNGSAWVRYSVVDGTMVPGSSDFMVAENDILYISN